MSWHIRSATMLHLMHTIERCVAPPAISMEHECVLPREREPRVYAAPLSPLSFSLPHFHHRGKMPVHCPCTTLELWLGYGCVFDERSVGVSPG